MVEFFFVLLYTFACIGVIYAADKRECKTWLAFIMAVFLTPVIAYLYIICHKSKEEMALLRRQNELLSSINDKLRKEEQDESDS